MNMPQLYKVIFLWLTLLSWCQDDSRQPSPSALIHSSLVLLFFSPGVGEISAAAVSSKPVLSGLRPNLQFALSTRGGGAALAMLAPGSSTQLVSG